jgi:hypothetical protein
MIKNESRPKFLMGLECKRNTRGRGREIGEGGEVKRIKLCHLCMYGDSIKKPIKYCF